jgi:tetratricopeptide (TPR) repeat protein
MRYFLLLACICCCTFSFGQASKHRPDPVAKSYLDSATAKYNRSGGDIVLLKEVGDLVDKAIKKDSLFMDAWVNKITLQNQLGQKDAALKTTRKMVRVFPNEVDALYISGIMEYHTAHKKEALVSLNKLLKIDNSILGKNENDPKFKGVLINKGIVLLLLDREGEGRMLLERIFDAEQDPYVKSYIGFYVNSTKEQIIEDRVPGK